MIIDMHVHLADHRIYPQYWLNGIKESISESLLRESATKLPDVLLDKIIENSLKDMDCTKLISEMDKAGIEISVIQLADLGYGRGGIQATISDLYSIHHNAKSINPDRLIVFAGMDPRRGKEGADLLEIGIQKYGFRGLKLYPPCGFELDDSAVYPLYDICAYYGIPVLVHTGPSLPGMYVASHYPSSVMRVAKSYKDMPFVLGHAALPTDTDSWKLPLEQKSIYLDLAGFQQFYNNRDILTERIRMLCNKCPENILFGTDWPLFDSKGSQKTWVSYFKDLSVLTDKQKELLLYKNAKALLSNFAI